METTNPAWLSMCSWQHLLNESAGKCASDPLWGVEGDTSNSSCLWAPSPGRARVFWLDLVWTVGHLVFFLVSYCFKHPPKLDCFWGDGRGLMWYDVCVFENSLRLCVWGGLGKPASGSFGTSTMFLILLGMPDTIFEIGVLCWASRKQSKFWGMAMLSESRAREVRQGC